MFVHQQTAYVLFGYDPNGLAQVERYSQSGAGYGGALDLKQIGLTSNEAVRLASENYAARGDKAVVARHSGIPLSRSAKVRSALAGGLRGEAMATT